MPLCLHLRNYVYEKKRICNLDIQWLAALPLPSTVMPNLKKMRLIKTISIFAITVLISCNSIKRDEANIDQIDENKSDVETLSQNIQVKEELFNPNTRINFLSSEEIKNLALVIDDSCSNANTLRRELIQFLRNENPSKDNFQLFRPLLIANMGLEDCMFPRDDEEQGILLEFSEDLFELSNTNKEAITLIVELRDYFPNNVEFTEHLFEIIPRVAIQNAHLFAKVAAGFGEEKRDRMIGNLELFRIDGLNHFINSISSISDTTLVQVIEEIKTQIDNEFPNHIEWK